MPELRLGLWHWQAPHPEWTTDQWWPQLVSSYAFDDGARLLFFDPLAVPDEIFEVAADREPVVVLTAPWHERDAQTTSLCSGSRVWVRSSSVDFGRGFEVPPEVLQHGVTREQVVEDLRPLLRLPVEVVLPAHGTPTDRAAIERALS